MQEQPMATHRPVAAVIDAAALKRAALAIRRPQNIPLDFRDPDLEGETLAQEVALAELDQHSAKLWQDAVADGNTQGLWDAWRTRAEDTLIRRARNAGLLHNERAHRGRGKVLLDTRTATPNIRPYWSAFTNAGAQVQRNLRRAE